MRIKGNTNKQKLSQVLTTVPYSVGDTVTLSAWLKSNKGDFSGTALLLSIHYGDSYKAKITLRPTLPYSDYQLISDDLMIGGPVNQVKVIIKVSQPGAKWLIDDVSVLHQPGEASRVIPLP